MTDQGERSDGTSREPTTEAPTAAEKTAQRLLDAQVEFILGEVTGDRFAEVVARDVDEVLAVAGTMTTREIVTPDDATETVLRLIDRIGGSAIVSESVVAFSDAIYDATASDDFRLGELVDREPVAALIGQFRSMHQLHNRALDRLTESPLVANLASLFVSKIVGDVMQQGRERAERIPGMGSVLSMGQSAASRVRRASDRHLNQFVGDMAGKSAQYALRKTNDGIRDVLRDPSFENAAMEVWDLHADEPISGLRTYLTREDLRAMVVAIHRIVVTSRNKPYIGRLVRECVDVFFEQYGDHSLAALLPELGISNDDVRTEILRYGPAVVEAAKRNGVLAGMIRDRLEPFFTAPATLDILA